MTIKQKVLFLEKPNVDDLKQFEVKFDCIYYTLSTLEQLLIDFRTSLKDIEGIYCGWNGFGVFGGFRGKLLVHAPRHLKIVATCSVGYDAFDIEGLSERNIILTNVPSPFAFEAVADLALYNAITSFRNFKLYAENLNNNQYAHSGISRTSMLHGEFDQSSGKAIVEPVVGHTYGYACCKRDNLSPRGHNAVIVGFGHIGELIGRRLACIGMNIHYVKRTRLSESQEKSLGYEVTYHESLEETKDIADLIIIACPGTPSTRHMINKQLISSIEKPFRIINIGRGFVIDEDALVGGLKSGKILFAGLDVFENEPTIHPDLLGRDDVVLTPHIGSGIAENYRFTAHESMKNIEITLRGYDEKISRVN